MSREPLHGFAAWGFRLRVAKRRDDGRPRLSSRFRGGYAALDWPTWFAPPSSVGGGAQKDISRRKLETARTSWLNLRKSTVCRGIPLPRFTALPDNLCHHFEIGP